MFAVRRMLISVAAGLAMSALRRAGAGSGRGRRAARAFLVEQVVAHTRPRPKSRGGRRSTTRSRGHRLDPRHEFVAPEAAPLAYFDLPLPAEHDLRESQPFIVAMMTDLVAPSSGGDLLILGIGGGYHAAVASGLVGSVYLLDLDATADRLGHGPARPARLRQYRGTRGRSLLWLARHLAIIRLAVDSVPSVLLRQLKPGGRLVAPSGAARKGRN
jgi:protein-L-isoaspartate(D-aspartate) O-methyltransferase